MFAKVIRDDHPIGYGARPIGWMEHFRLTDRMDVCPIGSLGKFPSDSDGWPSERMEWFWLQKLALSLSSSFFFQTWLFLFLELWSDENLDSSLWNAWTNWISTWKLQILIFFLKSFTFSSFFLFLATNALQTYFDTIKWQKHIKITK